MHLHLTQEEQTKVVVVLAYPSNIPPVWSVSDREVVEVNVADDGLSAEITALQKGVCVINVRTNCDVGSGPCEQNHSFEVEVSPTKKVLNFYAAIPSEKPSEAPQAYWTPTA